MKRTSSADILRRYTQYACGGLFVALLATTNAQAAGEHAHEHAVAPTAAAASGQKNTAGKKLATDAALRQGMAAIAALTGKHAQEIQAGSLQGPAYLEMAEQTSAQITYILKNCKLEPKADHLLHEVISDMNQSVELMRRNSTPIQRTGVMALNQALRNYVKIFDHPGWDGPK